MSIRKDWCNTCGRFTDNDDQAEINMNSTYCETCQSLKAEYIEEEAE